MSVRTCAECCRQYRVAPDELRRRGEAAETICSGCQVSAAHESWSPAPHQVDGWRADGEDAHGVVERSAEQRRAARRGRFQAAVR